jgi:hypothetical protein
MCSREHYEWAIDALHAISRWPAGVAALADIDAFEELQELVREETYDADRTQMLRAILDDISRYKAGKPDSVQKRVDL